MTWAEINRTFNELNHPGTSMTYAFVNLKSDFILYAGIASHNNYKWKKN